MKFIRYGKQGEEKPGILDDQGILRDLSEHVSDFNARTLSDMDLLNRLRSLNLDRLLSIDPQERMGPCVDTPGKIICVGFNSKRHNLEMGFDPVSESK